MNITYLVLCHTDPAHVARLARKLTRDTEDHVLIHVDAKTDVAPFAARLQGLPRVVLVGERTEVWWGGYSAVRATQRLLELALRATPAERIVLLQGADYPLRGNAALHDFFAAHPDTEFMRACNASTSRSRYIYAKARYPQWFDRPNLFKRVVNRVIRDADLKCKPAQVEHGARSLQIYWGCAQWAVTRRCAEYFLEYYGDSAFNRYFHSAFPADEIYFHTLVHNSAFARATLSGGAEDDVLNVTELRNLHYFEYPHKVRVFAAGDYPLLRERHELFVRKVNSLQSTALLDLIDAHD